MVPRLYLAAITLQPNWSTTDAASYRGIIRHWDLGVFVLVGIAFALIATAMAYAIVDVPSTGNARLPQSRFLRYRQLPLILAALLLVEAWALYCNLHGSEEFHPICAMWKFVVFALATYVLGGVAGSSVLRLPRFRADKARVRHLRHSVFRLLAILFSAALGGLCVWAIATRMM